MFIEESETNIQKEFQVIILSGYGNGLYPLTHENSMPKGLLPIANKPMLHYPLKWVEKGNFNEVIIAAYPEAKQKISHFVHEVFESRLKIHVVEVPDNCGSAEALRCLKPLIKCDFIVLSGDLVTDMPPQILIDSHRAQNNTVTALLHDARNLEGVDRLMAEGEIIGIEEKTNRLVFSETRQDINLRNPNGPSLLSIRHTCLAKFPKLTAHSVLRDAHLYVFKYWVLEFIARTSKLFSIKCDVLPLLMEFQHRPNLMDQYNIGEIVEENPPDIFARARQMNIAGNLNLPIVSCGAIVFYPGFTARANNIWKYGEINRYYAKLEPNTIPSTCKIANKAQVGSDSLIGESVTFGEKSFVKRSIIGNHTKIGANCKINNSIIMDHVVVEDGVKLESCIICFSGKISGNADLKDCEVAGKFVVESDTKAIGEKFVKLLDDE